MPTIPQQPFIHFIGAIINDLVKLPVNLVSQYNAAQKNKRWRTCAKPGDTAFYYNNFGSKTTVLIVAVNKETAWVVHQHDYMALVDDFPIKYLMIA